MEVAKASGVTGHQDSDDDMKVCHSRSPPHPSFLGLLLFLQRKGLSSLGMDEDGANWPRPGQRAQREEVASSEHPYFSPKGRLTRSQ